MAIDVTQHRYSSPLHRADQAAKSYFLKHSIFKFYLTWVHRLRFILFSGLSTKGLGPIHDRRLEKLVVDEPFDSNNLCPAIDDKSLISPWCS